MVLEVKDAKVKITKTIICSYQRKIERLYKERLRIYNLYSYENRLKIEGYSLVAGIDEAGRGALSGPVVAAAVILPCRLFIPFVKDSKKLSSQKRAELYCSILSKAKDVGIGVVEAKIIEENSFSNLLFLFQPSSKLTIFQLVRQLNLLQLFFHFVKQ